MRREIRALHSRIDVARSRNLKFFKAGNFAQRGDNLFRDFARRLAEFFGQLHGQRQRILPHGDTGRLRDGDILDLQLIFFAQQRAHPLGQLILQGQVQSSSS